MLVRAAALCCGEAVIEDRNCSPRQEDQNTPVMEDKDSGAYLARANVCSRC
jgi:hypothetical protein